MTGLDGRHGNQDGRIERKRGDTKIGTLKDQYQELNSFANDVTLVDLRDRFGVDSLSALIRTLRDR